MVDASQIVRLIYPESLWVTKASDLLSRYSGSSDHCRVIIRGSSCSSDDEVAMVPNHDTCFNISGPSALFQNSRTDLWLHESWSVSHFWRYCERASNPFPWSRIPMEYRRYNNDYIICEYLTSERTLSHHHNMLTFLSSRSNGLQLPVIPPQYPKLICYHLHPTTETALQALSFCLHNQGSRLIECSFGSSLIRMINMAIQIGAQQVYICGFDTGKPSYYLEWDLHNQIFRDVVPYESWEKARNLALQKLSSQAGRHAVDTNDMFVPLLLEYVRIVRQWSKQHCRPLEFVYMGESKVLSRIFSES
jgi:hypothetical protein